jgi:hypothetical protein
MPSAGPRYSMDEFARRGDEIYDQRIGPSLEQTSKGKFVAIDIETGEFEVDASEMAATDRLLARIPDAQIWFRRIGSKFARRFGPRSRGLES